MTPEQFCYWLQGYMELADNEGMTEKQVKTISDHLNTVFNKVTPDRSKKPKQVLNEKTQREKLQEVIDEMQKNRPITTCNPFDPHPGRIC